MTNLKAKPKKEVEAHKSPVRRIVDKWLQKKKLELTKPEEPTNESDSKLHRKG